jgi:hypothetical protein
MSPSKSSSAAPAAVTSALPENHLQHPESWATGGDPATGKQQAVVASLEKQHDVDLGIDEGQLGKSEASELIDKLKQGDVEGAKEIVGTGEKRGIDNVDESEAEGKADAPASKPDAEPDKESKPDATDVSSTEPPPAKKAKTDADDASASKDGEAEPSASPEKTAGDTATSAQSIAADGPTTTTDGAKIDPTKDTSTGAPAVTEANGESRLDHPENWATGASCQRCASILLVVSSLTGCMRPPLHVRRRPGDREAARLPRRAREAEARRALSRGEGWRARQDGCEREDRPSQERRLRRTRSLGPAGHRSLRALSFRTRRPGLSHVLPPSRPPLVL